jgi:3-hydroxymyristoyl/3-hydroxydecanoyl-(acyl carrier protein) dehydratase
VKHREASKWLIRFTFKRGDNEADFGTRIPAEVTSHIAECCIPTDHPAADGHFPGNPIIPGAVLLREIVSVLSAGSDAVCCEIRSARFLQPVRPGDRLTIVWEDRTTGEFSFTCSTGSPERRVLFGTLRMQAR